MFPPSSLASRLAGSRGFTLLELLVVIVVLAALGGAAIVAAGNTREYALQQVALLEMQKIKHAMLQFRQDTGYFPGQGPFALIDAGTTENPDGTCTFTSSSPAGGVRRDSVVSALWFASPANFMQLYVPPVMCTNHPQAALVQPWQASIARGWRGPYLSALGEGLVDIGAALEADGDGAPWLGSTLPNVRGVADPFVASPVNPGGYTACEESTNNAPNDCLLDWRTATTTDTHSRWGRPYLLFDLDKPNKARLVSLGPDGRYGDPNPNANNSEDSSSDFCVPAADSDDLVLCLLR